MFKLFRVTADWNSCSMAAVGAPCPIWQQAATVTVRAVLFWPSEVAGMVAVPGEMACRLTVWPLPTTWTTAGLDEVHELVRPSRVELVEESAVAVAPRASPAYMSAEVP